MSQASRRKPGVREIRADTASGVERRFIVPEEGLPATPVTEGDELTFEENEGDTSLRSLVSLVLVIIGTLLASVGAGLVWGPGIALLVGGAIFVVVGVLMGATE